MRNLENKKYSEISLDSSAWEDGEGGRYGFYMVEDATLNSIEGEIDLDLANGYAILDKNYTVISGEDGEIDRTLTSSEVLAVETHLEVYLGLRMDY